MMKLNLNRVSRKLKSLTIGYYRSQKFFQNRHVNFLIIGVQKAGTTSLAHFLAQHPQCMTAKSKEVHFFDLDYRYNNGINWYHRQFDLDGYNSQNEPVCIFEKSPGYIFYPDAAKRIYDYNPKMKLIVLFREPAERAYFAWNMWRQL